MVLPLNIFLFSLTVPKATSTPDILIYSWHSWFPSQNFRHPTPGTKHSHHRHIWCVFLVHQHSPRWRDWCMLQRFGWEWSHFTPITDIVTLMNHVLTNSVVVETVSETSHLCWNNETIRFKSSLTSIIIESTYLTLNMNKIWGCFKVQVGWKNAFYGETGSRKGRERVSARPWPLKNIFNLHFVNKIIIYKFSMFKSLDSIASVVGIFMYLTISKLKQVLRSRKGLDYNTANQEQFHFLG